MHFKYIIVMSHELFCGYHLWYLICHILWVYWNDNKLLNISTHFIFFSLSNRKKELVCFFSTHKLPTIFFLYLNAKGNSKYLAPSILRHDLLFGIRFIFHYVKYGKNVCFSSTLANYCYFACALFHTAGTWMISRAFQTTYVSCMIDNNTKITNALV